MAPGAQMDLANFDTEVELANASQWLTAQGVTIINASWGYFTSGPGDGTGVVDDVVTQSTAAGTLWSVAAGNHATQHWSGPFNDQDNNSWHEFQNSPFIDEGNEVRGFFGFLFAGDPVAAELKWDDPFGASCRDYDLYLKRTDDAGLPVTVAASENRQNDGGCVPGANPVEQLATTVPVTDIYHLTIQKHAAATNANMDLYSAYQDLEYVVTAGSGLQPPGKPQPAAGRGIQPDRPQFPEPLRPPGPAPRGTHKP